MSIKSWNTKLEAPAHEDKYGVDNRDVTQKSNRAWKRQMAAQYVQLNTCNRRARRNAARALLLIADCEANDRVWIAHDEEAHIAEPMEAALSP